MSMKMNPLFLAACTLACLLVVGCPSPSAPPSSNKDLTSFGFVSPHATGVITGSSVNVLLLNGTAVTGLVATFTTTGVSVTVGSTVQVSGSTSNDFTSPVNYVVTAADGSTKTYSVTVSAHLGERRYLTTPAGVPASNLDVVATRMHLKSGTNPFPDNTPVVFLNGAAPVGMSYGTICYATGYGTASLLIASLADSSLFSFAASSQVGTGTCYAVDWTALNVGTVTLAADGIIHLDPHLVERR